MWVCVVQVGLHLRGAASIKHSACITSMFAVYFSSVFQCIQADTEEGRLRLRIILSVHVRLLVLHAKT